MVVERVLHRAFDRDPARKLIQRHLAISHRFYVRGLVMVFELKLCVLLHQRPQDFIVPRMLRVIAAGEEVLSCALVAVEIEHQIEPELVHFMLDAFYLGRFCFRPVAVHVGARGVHARVSQHIAVWIRIRNNVERVFGE